MTMTAQDKRWHKEYQNLSYEGQQLIDELWKVCYNEMKAKNLKPTNGDEAEALVAAITRYYLDAK